MESVQVGGRDVALEEFFKIAHGKAQVTLDTPALAQMKKSAGIAKNQKAPEPHAIPDSPGSVVMTTAEARATTCFHLVWFMAGRSDVRPEVVEAMASMLNDNVVPPLPKSSSCVTVLTAAICKHVGTPLTPIEEFAFSRDAAGYQTATLALEVFMVNSIMDTADGVAALSCEALQTPFSVFNEADYVSRPHRGIIESADNMRIYLKDSTNLEKEGKRPTKKRNLNACESTPQFHGPARWDLPGIARSLKTELNGAPALGARASNDTTPVDIASQTYQLYLSKVLEATAARSALVQAKLSGALAAPVDLRSSITAGALINNLAAEAKTAVQILEARRMEVEQKNKAKELLAQKKAEEYAAKMAAAGKSVDDSKKKKKKKEGGMKTALSLGAGVSVLLKLLLSVEGEYILGVIDPRVDGLLTAKFLRDVLEKIGSGGAQRVPKIAKGARDFQPGQMQVRQEAFDIIRGVFRRHGAVEIDTPVFELKETLTGKYGEDSKLIYELADQGGELLALRYDLTVPFARFLATNSVGNIKRFHIGKVYRRDAPNAAKGRFREFYQCDYDVAGDYDPMIPETEVLSVAIEILRALPIGNFAIKLNHRVLLDAMLDICGVPEEKFRMICSAIDKLDKEPWSAVRCEMIDVKGLDPAVADRIGRFVNEDSDIRDGSPLVLHAKLVAAEWTGFSTHPRASKAMADLKLLFEYLEVLGVLDNVSFDLSLARGLDYYTGLIYEAVITDEGERVGSIAAGGRYDNLVGMFSGKPTPCIGVSIGVERVFAIMERKAKQNLGLKPNDVIDIPTKPVDVLVTSTGGSFLRERMQACAALWRAGVSAKFVYRVDVTFKKQLQKALEENIPFLVIIGEDEIAKGVCQVKNLSAHDSEEIAIGDMPALLAGKLNASATTGSDILGAMQGLSIEDGSKNEAPPHGGLKLSNCGRFYRPNLQ